MSFKKCLTKIVTFLVREKYIFFNWPFFILCFRYFYSREEGALKLKKHSHLSSVFPKYGSWDQFWFSHGRNVFSILLCENLSYTCTAIIIIMTTTISYESNNIIL